MATAGECVATWDEAPVRQSEWRRLLRVFFRRKLAVVGLVIILLMIIVAIFAPLIAPYDPYTTDLGNKLLHPSS